jgi:hypothetical protein
MAVAFKHALRNRVYIIVRIISATHRFCIMGNHQLAAAELAKVSDEYQLIENDTYHAAVNYLKGNYEREDFLKSADTIGKYAVAMKDNFEGRNDEAIRHWNELTDAGPHGFWPAEAELLMIADKN